MKRFCHFLFLSVLSFNSITVWGQQLIVQANSGKQVVLSRSDIDVLPHVKVNVNNLPEPATFEGVSLKSVLEKAGIEFGETLKGKQLATCLVVEAADNYRVVIALPELDPAFTNKQILLIFLRDGKPLVEKE